CASGRSSASFFTTVVKKESHWRQSTLPPVEGETWASRGSREGSAARSPATSSTRTVAPHTPLIRVLLGDGQSRLLRHVLLEARHHLAREQLHGVAPGLRVLAVVEAEEEEMAKATHLVVDLLQSLGHGGGRTHHPVVTGAVLGSDIGDRHVGPMLEEFQEAEGLEEGKEILPHHAPHHAPRGQAHGFRVGVG